MSRHSLGFHGPVETRLHFEDGAMIAEDIMHAPQVQEILDQNQRDRSIGRNMRAQGRHVARVPITLHHAWYTEWQNKYQQVWTWQTYIAMKLNSRDYAYLRTGANKI